MRRLAVLLLTSGLLWIGGCASFVSETNPEEPWTPQRWEEMKEENQQRLAGEDRAKKSLVSSTLCAVPNAMWSGLSHIWDWAAGNTPATWAKDLFNKSADKRREAIYELADHPFGRKEPYTKYYAHMADNDNDFTVRAAAIRALNQSRDQTATPIFIRALEDPSDLVRTEAAKALANIPDEKAIPALARHLEKTDENRDTRLAAADALRNYKTSGIAQTLIRVLQDRDFGVSWQARQSLNLMTGQDFRYNQADWLAYLTGPQKPFG